MSLACVLFDFDGTLADTALDLGGALNVLRRKNGLPEIPMTLIRPIASHGANGLIKLGFNITKDSPDFMKWRTAFLDEYAKCFMQSTVLYDGVNDMIEHLVSKGLKWGIVTNKPERFTIPLVESLNFVSPPGVIVSGDSTDKPKPSPLPIKKAMADLGVEPKTTIYVGDALRDIEAGKKARCRTVQCMYGYLTEKEKLEDWEPNVRVNSVAEIKQVVDKWL